MKRNTATLCKDCHQLLSIEQVNQHTMTTMNVDTSIPNKKNTNIGECSETDEESYMSSCSSTKKKSVRFSTVEFRKFNRILGCNPACTAGPPVDLDWDYVQNDPILVEEYETNRVPRRPRQRLIMSTDTRKDIMSKNFGYTQKEIKEAANSIKAIQKSRFKSKNEAHLGIFQLCL